MTDNTNNKINGVNGGVISDRIAVIKLKRIQELNNRLKDTLRRERIPASNACLLLINYIQETPDYLIPYIFKLPLEQNKYARYQTLKNLKANSKNTSNGGGAGCCIIM
ncbi:Ste18 protein [Scheffersomyces amazonensis]|uniref:Ste18 protein n=1 Tax=Scheffersomyces amazonensis TaxID=1078765 RepID=UPI00315D2AED